MINLEDIITATSIIWIQKYLEWKHTLEWLRIIQNGNGNIL